jgi:16S rRNA (uracil1498-N3)-methyltransferase
VNHVLFAEEEIAPDGAARLGGPDRPDDPRARHVLDVLRAKVADRIRIGLLDGPRGLGTVRAIAAEPATVELTCVFDESPPSVPTDTLILAVPRPKVLRRCLATAAALGFGHIVLVRTWRVDPTHLQSRGLRPEPIRDALLDGLAQARRTHVPRLSRCDRFRPFVEDQIEDLLRPRPGAAPPARYVAAVEDGSAVEIGASDEARSRGAPIAVAIGPERGFVPYEVARLRERGFRAVRAGESPLTVENALTYVTARLRAFHGRA